MIETGSTRVLDRWRDKDDKAMEARFGWLRRWREIREQVKG